MRNGTLIVTGLLVACTDAKGDYLDMCSTHADCEAPLFCAETRCSGHGTLSGTITTGGFVVLDPPAHIVIQLQEWSSETELAGVIECAGVYEVLSLDVSDLPAAYVLDGLPPGTWHLIVFIESQVAGGIVPMDFAAIQVDDDGRVEDAGGITDTHNFSIRAEVPYDC